MSVIKEKRTGHLDSVFYMDKKWGSIKDIASNRKVFYVVDERVYALYQDDFLHKKFVVLPNGEGSKTMDTIAFLIDCFIEFELDKSMLVLALGGGVLCDTTGFAASIYMRGIPFAFVPTTLLAMVDAAVGGKNGVNYKGIKNLLGTIKQPEFILYDFDFLKTLPNDEIVSAVAEVVKYGAIESEPLIRFLEQNTKQINEADPTILKALVQKSVSIKKNVVQRDLFEHGIRKHLNFGHTFGHAVEISQSLKHGYAVSLGMVMALLISVGQGNLEQGVAQRIMDLLQRLNLPVQFSNGMEASVDYMSMDKKKNGTAVQYVLLNGIGEAEIQHIDLEVLKNRVKEHILQSREI